MSRHPANESISTHSKISEKYLNFVTKHAVPRAMRLKEIIEATNADKTLNGLQAAIRLHLSASCGGMSLNWVYRHPSQLSVPKVPTAVPPKLQPY